MRYYHYLYILFVPLLGLYIIIDTYMIGFLVPGRSNYRLMHGIKKKDLNVKIEKESSKTYPNTTKTILWIDAHNYQRMEDFSQCNFANCVIKYVMPGRSVKRMEDYTSDAVVIQGKLIFTLFPPLQRPRNQIYILLVKDAFRALNQRNLDEDKKMEQWIHFFNWTITYRKDSDIVYKYSNIVEKHKASYQLSKNYDHIFTEKKKDAVWLVSHCKTKSRREDYVNDLKTVIDVDIYGGCGQKPACPKGDHSCFEDMAKTYKFYLAFENTFYDDYVTEKLFNWFNLDIIVVVRGGANYSTVVPPGTIIDASDFSSAVKLGRYLQQLAADKERYLAYLKRKDHYYSIGKSSAKQEALCKLCEFLHTVDKHRKTYSNILSWWSKGRKTAT